MGEHRGAPQDDMQVVVLRPGDKLVIGVKRPISLAEADEMRVRVRERLPGVDLVVIVAEQLLAYRPDEVSSVRQVPTVEGDDDG